MSDNIAVSRDVTGYIDKEHNSVLMDIPREDLVCCEFCPSRICHTINRKVDSVISKAVEGTINFSVSVTYQDCAACGRIMIADELNTIARSLTHPMSAEEIAYHIKDRVQEIIDLGTEGDLEGLAILLANLKKESTQ